MRHAKLHRAGSVVQAGIQLRGGCLGVGLHIVRSTGGPTALRHGHAQGNVREDLQQSLSRSGWQYCEQERPGSNQVAAAIQSRATTESGKGEGARLSHEGIRAGVVAAHLLLPDATGIYHRATLITVLGFHGRQESTGSQQVAGERSRNDLAES